MTTIPARLHTAAVKIAAHGDMQRVVMQVAMALGASVHPLTRITPSVSSVIISSGGLLCRLERKSERLTLHLRLMGIISFYKRIFAKSAKMNAFCGEEFYISS